MRPCCAPSSWVVGRVARGCAVRKGRSRLLMGCPALPWLGGDGAGHPRPLCGSGWTYHKVACHMQSVIAGCKAVLPPLSSVETSTHRENPAFPGLIPDVHGA